MYRSVRVHLYKNTNIGEMFMKDTLFMSVDLGTSFVKVGVYDTESRCIAIASEPVKDERPAPGMFIQHGEDLFQSVVASMKKAAAEIGDRAKNVEAVAFTGQMAGFMGVDEDWNDITGWSCSLDTRYIPYANAQYDKLKDKFLNISGTNSPLMCAKYEWFRADFPEEAKKVRKYVMISSYVLGKLGKVDIEEATIDGSFISWTGMADVASKNWSEEILDDLGMDRSLLPKVVDSNAICGYLDPGVAADIGIKGGIPLVSGAGDKVSGNVGAKVLDKGDMIFEAGSYGAVSCVVDEYRADSEWGYYDAIRGAAGKDLYLHKYIPGSGITLDWFIDTFVQTEGMSLKDAFKEIEKGVEACPIGCDGLMAIGLLGGSAMPFDGAIKGTWMGYTWSHGKADFYRALLESYSYDLALTIDRMEALYPDMTFDDIKLIGGGAKSPVWSQMLADATGKRFHTINRDDIALWGAAILAGNAIGVFEDIRETAGKHVGISKVWEPNMEAHAKYQPLKLLYRDFAKDLHGHYVRLAEAAK